MTMRKALLLSTALTLGALNPALAGGPIVIAEEREVVEAAPASSSGAVIPLLLLGVVLAIVVSRDDDEPEAAISDIRLKTDVQRVGTNRLGLGVYRWRYKGLDGVWEGVMAHEVAIMHPGAVRALPMGYKAVDYARLGLEMKRVA
jgi:hypothetical protein